MEYDLTKFGGVKTTLMGADPDDPNPNLHTWNFGVVPKTDKVDNIIRAKPSLYSAFPKIEGLWDGKSTVNHFDAATKVMGSDAVQLIQNQPRGTCGGRAGSAAGDFMQLIAIAGGKKAEFHRISHAAVYYMARKVSGMIGGNWQDEDNDGVASGSVPKALEQLGFVQRDEDNDSNWYGAGSDDLACQLAAGMKQDVAKAIITAGGDNLLTSWHPVSSAQELADGIAAGGIGIGSDNQGFTMTRDKDGFCRPTGTWSHYQIRVACGTWNGRKGFGYWQSWGSNAPSGTLLQGLPGNCFGVDFDTQDRIIKSGDWAVVFGFPLFDLENNPDVVPWIF